MLRKRFAALGGLFWIGMAICSGQAEAHHLFNTSSGFAKARHQKESIRVCAPAVIDGPAVIAPWNRLAGWQLFALSCEHPDVTYVGDRVTWVETTYRQSFTHCRIHYASPMTKVHQHEIGHCLGFADHVAPGGDDSRWVNAQQCAGYRGVMSYCDWNGQAWFGDDDRAMLILAGYAAPAPVGTEARDSRAAGPLTPVATDGGPATDADARPSAEGPAPSNPQAQADNGGGFSRAARSLFRWLVALLPLPH